MRDRFGLIFVVLMLCGTICILGSLTVLGLLFHAHAPIMSIANKHEFPVYAVSFLFFVVVPALITIFAGIWMAGTGIRMGQKSSAELPDQKQP